MSIAQMSRPVAQCVALAALASGAAGLMYQTLWARAMASVLGGTAEGAAVALAAFMAGMTAGAIGARAVLARTRSPLRLYVYLEVAIACMAVGAGLGLQAYGDLLGAWIGVSGDEPLRAGLVALVLIGVPSLPIGAALPCLVRVADDLMPQGEHANALYGRNVLGSALGVVLVGFLSIRLLGIQGSYFAAAWLNVLAVAAVVVAGRRGRPAGGMRQRAPDRPGAGSARGREFGLLALAFLSGWSVFVLEVLYTHLAQFLLGNRIYAISVLLITVLLQLALAARLVEGLRPSLVGRRTEAVAAVLTAASAAGVVASLYLADLLTRYQPALEEALAAGTAGLLAVRLGLAVLVITPAILPLGTVFPACLALSGRVRRDGGTGAAGLLAVNTLGAVVGALMAAFWILDAVGLWGGFQLVAGVLVAAFVISMARIAWRRRQVVEPVSAGVTALALLVVAGVWAPRTPPPAVGDGVRLFAAESAQGIVQVYRRDSWSCDRPGRCLWLYSGRHAIVWTPGARETLYAQALQAHLGGAYARDFRRALVIGAGVGVTAGDVAAYQEIDRVDVVEIDPGVFEAAAHFAPESGDYLADPKVVDTVADGRHYLRGRRAARWDLITVNPTSPMVPGAAALFHREFYELARDRLAPGGVFVAQIFGGAMENAAAGIAEVFPYARAIRSYSGSSWVIVASMRPLEMDTAAFRDRIDAAGVQARMRRAGIASPISPVRLLKDLPRLRAVVDVEGVAPITDNNPIGEFALPGQGAGLFRSSP